MDAIRAERELRLKSSPEALWPLVSNTDRLNRAVGLPAAVSEPIPGSFDRLARARVYGLPLEWRERPFDFVAPRFHRSVRVFTRGPAARFEGGVRLEPDGAGTRAVVHAAFVPADALGALVLRALVPKSVADMAAMIERLDESLSRPGALPPLPRTRTPAREGEQIGRAHV